MPATFVDDAALVVALRMGDEGAFGHLLDRYDGLLRRLARAYVSCDAVAEDVVGDTWLAVVRGIDGFEGRSSLKTWIVRILTNQASRQGMKESRSRPFSSIASPDDADAYGGWEPAAFLPEDHVPWPGSFAGDVPAWGSSPLDTALRNEVVDVVRAAAGRLPDAQRVVFELRDVHGWTSREVIDALEVSEGNQRVLLHRARGRVRRALNDYLVGAEAAM